MSEEAIQREWAEARKAVESNPRGGGLVLYLNWDMWTALLLSHWEGGAGAPGGNFPRAVREMAYRHAIIRFKPGQLQSYLLVREPVEAS